MHDTPDPQLSFTMPGVARVRAHYASLCAVGREHAGAASLAGKFLLIDGLAGEGDALAIAASIAGAASLVLETRGEAVRYCVRNGIVDFAVTTLDEALRILKNEIRKRQPVAVLLEREPGEVLAEIVERGAQPDMLRWAAEKPAAAALRERGAFPISPPASVDTSREVCWRAREGGSVVLRQLDLMVAQVVPSEDAERQNWISRAPRYLPRALRLERRVALTVVERVALLAALQERVQEGSLAGQVEIEAGGQIQTFRPQS